jgi:hypothetical protein
MTEEQQARFKQMEEVDKKRCVLEAKLWSDKANTPIMENTFSSDQGQKNASSTKKDKNHGQFKRGNIQP